MTRQYQVADLVPHSGQMSLLTDILDYGEDWLQAEVEITAESTFADAQGVPAWIGLEYMAQSIAAYSGLQERREGGVPKIGLLLGTRKYRCSVDRFPLGSRLAIRVEPELVGDTGLNVFNCELESGEITASATINVFQPEDADAFLEAARQ